MRAMEKDEWEAMFRRSRWRLWRDGDLTLRDIAADWWLSLRCTVLGHRWKAHYEWYPGAGSNYEGTFCERCSRPQP